jgi:hypothetical protein
LPSANLRAARKACRAIAPLPIANIPAILTAAGTAVAFATVYAAYALYDFLVPATAFALLGIVAMCTMAAALLHGPALAGLGIAAAFVTPVLVSSGKPDYWALYIYLAIVMAAAFSLARIRLWRWLALTTIVFATLWTLPGLDAGDTVHSRRMRSMSWPASFWPRCWSSAASCMVRRPKKAASKASRRVRSVRACSARRWWCSPASMPIWPWSPSR